MYQLPSVPVSVLWARLEKSYNLSLDVRNIFAGSHTERLWRCSLLIMLLRKFYIFCSLSSVLLVWFNPLCFGIPLGIPFILQKMWKESLHCSISLLLEYIEISHLELDSILMGLTIPWLWALSPNLSFSQFRCKLSPSSWWELMKPEPDIILPVHYQNVAFGGQWTCRWLNGVKTSRIGAWLNDD